MKTILIHNGASKVGIEKIRELLSENNYTTNELKNRILCIDTPDKVCSVQEFLGIDEFSFLAQDAENPLDINEHIDQVIIAKDF
ncbi:MAG: hypothetical protein IKC10_03430 [Alphaproteobacteria bacterium]|nr:hypothetical protein [Alphaproteobacteria bacterium]